MIAEYIRTHVVDFVHGGVTISHGSLFVIIIWATVAQIRKFIRKKSQRV